MANQTIIDGNIIPAGETRPDLGSWVAKDTKTAFREYYGLSKDKDKLPHYVQTGSSAFCVDTLEIGYFDASTDTWYWM